MEIYIQNNPTIQESNEKNRRKFGISNSVVWRIHMAPPFFPKKLAH
jgi:hypothetical protein